VSAAIPGDGAGAIIMLHDGGGNRDQTLAALPGIITELKARGYQFTTVTSALRLADADVPVAGSSHLAGTLATPGRAQSLVSTLVNTTR
jgi:hypothetical protein